MNIQQRIIFAPAFNNFAPQHDRPNWENNQRMYTYKMCEKVFSLIYTASGALLQLDFMSFEFEIAGNACVCVCALPSAAQPFTLFIAFCYRNPSSSVVKHHPNTARLNLCHFRSTNKCNIVLRTTLELTRLHLVCRFYNNIYTCVH